MLLGACLILGALALLVLEIVAGGVDYPRPAVHRVNLREGASVLDEPGGPPATTRPRLRVAVAPVVSPERSLEIYQGFIDHLANEMARDPVFLRRGSYAEVNDLVRFHRCDLAFVCTYAFVRGEREFGMRALAVPVVEGETVYYSYVIVPAGSPVKTMLDLRGRRFASADIMSNSGWLFPVTWLRSRGEDPERFFSEHRILGSHDRSIEAVVAGLADGAAVHSLVFEEMIDRDPTLGEKTKIILKSAPFGMPPLVVSARIDPDLERDLRRALLEMHTTPKGMKLLTDLGFDRFVPLKPGLYDSVRAAASRVGSFR
jgi:phosphonate transport system substrate-binding protein